MRPARPLNARIAGIVQRRPPSTTRHAAQSPEMSAIELRRLNIVHAAQYRSSLLLTDVGRCVGAAFGRPSTHICDVCAYSQAGGRKPPLRNQRSSASLCKSESHCRSVFGGLRLRVAQALVLSFSQLETSSKFRREALAAPSFSIDGGVFSRSCIGNPA